MDPLLPHKHPETEKEFFVSNGVATKNHNHNEDIEMITVQPTCYTSLRDIIATTAAAEGAILAPASPPSTRSSWDDVPIRNPLVKQAALAYLQPKSTPTEIDHRSWGERMKANLHHCFAGDGEDDDVEVGCVGFVDGVLLAPIKQVFGRILRVMERRANHED